MLYKLDDSAWIFSPSQFNDMKEKGYFDNLTDNEIMEPFNVYDLKYIDGFYAHLELYDILDILGLDCIGYLNYQEKCNISPTDFSQSSLDKAFDITSPDFHVYGVCDSIDNLLEKYPEILTNDTPYVISLSSISKEFETKRNFRWHKNGPYIGNKNPRFEYFYDEDDSIQEVFVYRIYKILGGY